MRRYYVCPVVGDGSESSPYRPKVADYGVSYVALLGQNPDGSTRRQWAFVLVNALDHTSILADNQIFALPDLSLDATLGALSNPQRNAVIRYMNDIGIDTSGVNTNTTVRDVVRLFAAEQESPFDENAFDVGA